MRNEIIEGDCLLEMPFIPDKSIDMVLADLPYGTTACEWDSIIPFEQLWEQYNRIIKDNGAIVLTASQPFTTKLINSNIKHFKYELIWQKTRPTGFFNAKRAPLKAHENILVFYKKQSVYNPIKTQAPEHLIDKRKTINQGNIRSNVYGASKRVRKKDDGTRYPITILTFPSLNKQHPTQKPFALMEYLIKTYTNEGDLVLDNTAGSGTTGVACINTNRDYILIEKDPEYFKILENRINEAYVLDLL